MRILLKNIFFTALLVYCYVNFLSAQMRDPLPLAIRCRQLIAGPTVLMVTIRPGDEDFEGVSSLRVTSGARVAFLHLTNGESVPSETWPWARTLVETRRKEEALKSAHVYGGNSYFLNLPDTPVDSDLFHGQWNVDSVAAKIATVINLVKPHIILFCAGRMSPLNEVQNTVIGDALGMAADRCAKGMLNEHNGSSSWQTQCIATTKSFSGDTKTYVLVPKESNAKEASILTSEARSCYASILSQELHGANKKYGYQLLRQIGKAAAHALVDRIQLTTSRLYSVRNIVRAAGETVLKGGVIRRKEIDAAAESVSACLREGLQRYSALDQRALVHWKGDLDYFQANNAEKYFNITVSDSILTESQVFFIGVHIVHPDYRQGITQIIFHKAKSDGWIINESLERVFDLKRDSVFRVLSPEKLKYSVPVALHGLNRLTLGEPFRFSIIHQGRTKSESCIITKEVPLRYSPRHASVVQTPIVPITSASRLILDSYNFTRDPVDGMLFVKDSICWSDTVRFSLANKDEVRRDTFHLHWADGLSAGDYLSDIRASNRSVGTFLGRKMAHQPSRSTRIALVTDRVVSPLEEYFQILGAQAERIPWQQISDTHLENKDVLVIDRDTRIDYPDLMIAIGQWIKEGGRVIVLPQFSTTDQKNFLNMGIGFHRESSLNVNSLIAKKDYQKYLHGSDAMVRGILDCSAPSAYEGMISTRDGRLVLASKHEGHGSIIISALDLDVWIAQVDTIGYELFEKLVFFQ